jgi:hypothetical protein
MSLASVSKFAYDAVLSGEVSVQALHEHAPTFLVFEYFFSDLATDG